MTAPVNAVATISASNKGTMLLPERKADSPNTFCSISGTKNMATNSVAVDRKNNADEIEKMLLANSISGVIGSDAYRSTCKYAMRDNRLTPAKPSICHDHQAKVLPP